MRHLTKVNAGLSVIVFMLIWVPFSRLFMTEYAILDYFIGLISIVLIVSSIFALKNKQSRMNIITLIIGFSPLIFIIVSLILYKMNPMP